MLISSVAPPVLQVTYGSQFTCSGQTTCNGAPLPSGMACCTSYVGSQNVFDPAIKMCCGGVVLAENPSSRICCVFPSTPPVVWTCDKATKVCDVPNWQTGGCTVIS